MNKIRIPADIRLDELFDVVVRDILRPLKRHIPKSLDHIVEVGLKRGRARLWLIKEDRLLEHILRVAIEMQLLSAYDEKEAREQIRLIVQGNGL